LEEFFGKYGAVNQVRMRRDEKKKFKVVFIVLIGSGILRKF